MTEIRLRIPPLSRQEWLDQFLSNTDLSHHDAQQMAVEAYANSMEAIYRMARIGEKCLAEHAQDSET